MAIGGLEPPTFSGTQCTDSSYIDDLGQGFLMFDLGVASTLNVIQLRSNPIELDRRAVLPG